MREEIVILSTREIIVRPAIDEEIPMIRITYQYGDIIGTVWIDKDKATEENILKLIMADLKRRGVKIHGGST